MIIASLVTEIKDYVSSLLPEYLVARYSWEVEKNNDPKMRKFFAVRPLGISYLTGTTRTFTYEQQFEIEFFSTYKNIRDTDENVDEKIIEIQEDHLFLSKFVLRENFAIPRVQAVNAMDLSDPRVDNINKLCSVTATYTIKYRME